MTTLKDLVNMVHFTDMWEELKVLYDVKDKAFEGYCRVYNRLRDLEPVKDEDMTIYIEFVQESTEEDSWYHVFGRIKDEDTCYGLNFTPWKNWLSYEIKTDLEMNNAQLLAHILWEMTFDGFEEQKIQETKKDLEKIVEDVEKGNIELRSMEDFWENFDLDLKEEDKE